MGVLLLRVIGQKYFIIFLIPKYSVDYYYEYIWDKLEWKGISYFIKDHTQQDLSYLNNHGINFFSETDQLLLAICKCLTQTGNIKDKYFQKTKDNDLENELIMFYGFNYLSLLGKSKIVRFLTLTYKVT